MKLGMKLDLPLTVAAAKQIQEEMLTRWREAQTVPSKDRLNGQLRKLSAALYALEHGRDMTHSKLHRFLAFVLISSVKLPEDWEKVPAVAAELELLGFDMVGLTAESVYEAPISGRDFLP